MIGEPGSSRHQYRLRSGSPERRSTQAELRELRAQLAETTGRVRVLENLLANHECDCLREAREELEKEAEKEDENDGGDEMEM